MLTTAGVVLLALGLQGGTNGTGPGMARTAAAVRAAAPILVDGREADAAWAAATPITDFVEFVPNEGKAPRFATEVRVAYDQRNFYVFVRAFDDEPERILRHLARRDVRPPTDQIKIIIDSYFDKRSGYEFAVSPSGVKRDYIIYNDGAEDGAWDGVWDVATTVDSLGWTAEFRIPLSQLRYPSAESHTFGFGVWRDIERHKERVSWPLYSEQRAGIASQLGELTGIRGLSAPRRLEVTPYAVTRNVTVANGPAFDHRQRLAAGADFKYGVTSNLTLDGTINPDFGQVEADPSVLNLGAFETFFQERRPFFLEGVGLFQWNVNCTVVNDCGRETLFYSRRVGRAPQLGGLYGDAESATATTILGAAKLTGRLPSGLSLGLLNAVTQREKGEADRTIEPTTSYTVVRALQDFRGGETGVGVIGTFVHRSLDQWTEGQLRSSAVVGGLDFRHRFLNREYEFSVRALASRVSGSAEAMDLTQRSTVHAYHRPDAGLDYDPARTSLGGDFEQVKFGKFGGQFRFETSYQRTSPGFEINDLGFLNRADKQNQATWAQVSFNRPTRLYRRGFWNFNQWNDWTSDGLPLDRAVNTNFHFELPNSWWIHLGGTLGGLGEVYCDRCARGGPALRTDGIMSSWGGIEGDDRHPLVPSVWFNYWEADEGRTESVDISPSLRFRVSSRLSMSAGLSFSRNSDDRQWYGNFTDQDDGETHYTFAHLEQRTTSFTGRLDFTATPTLTLQVYGSPYITKGHYSDLRELDAPRAADYDDRFRPYTAITDPGGFNFKQFRSNVVARWEYRPGSAVYLVWQQGRTHSEDEQGQRSFRGDLRELFRAHPDNTFLIKVSYWFDR